MRKKTFRVLLPITITRLSVKEAYFFRVICVINEQLKKNIFKHHDAFSTEDNEQEIKSNISKLVS